MSKKILWLFLGVFILSCSSFAAEVRTYRQFKNVATQEKGKVRESVNPGDLFEYTYSIDLSKNTVTRVMVRRLDQKTPQNDSTVYNITGDKDIIGSEAGNGGRAIVAVQRGGSEILELTHRFAFTARTSPFSQLITGVYRRVWDQDKDFDFGRDEHHGKGR